MPRRLETSLADGVEDAQRGLSAHAAAPKGGLACSLAGQAAYFHLFRQRALCAAFSWFGGKSERARQGPGWSTKPPRHAFPLCNS